jgi:hypothetical protein
VKLDNERKAREAEAAKEAAAAAAAALAARQEAETTTDIAVVEDAQDKMTEAMSLIKQAQSIGKAKVKVGVAEAFARRLCARPGRRSPPAKKAHGPRRSRHFCLMKPLRPTCVN